MHDEIAFLRTILEHPDEDGPRLVYADWLEETGATAQAEFIRIQIELTHIPATQPRAIELRMREAALIKQYGLRWRRRVGSWIRDCEFRRGVMEFVRVTGNSFARYGRRLFERAAVTRVRLSDAAEVMERVAISPALSWVRELDIGYNVLTERHLMPLVQSELVSKLRVLDLSANRLHDLGAMTLASSRRFERLQLLLLPRNNLSGSGLTALVTGHWPALIHLDLSNNLISVEGLRDFIASPLAPQLRSLSLAHNRFGDHGVAVLARGERLTHLTELNLAATNMADSGAIALAHSPHMAALERLDLRQNEIGPDGARALATSRYLTDLRYLAISGYRLGRTVADQLRRRFGDGVEGIPKF